MGRVRIGGICTAAVVPLPMVVVVAMSSVT